jgi:hypothetical protein
LEAGGERTTGAISLRNVSDDGEVCRYRQTMLVVRRALCPTCREVVLSITPTYVESFLPEGKIGESPPFAADD